jgi:hypothetical protein
MSDGKIDHLARGVARDYASQAGAVDMAANVIVDLLISTFDMNAHPYVHVSKSNEGLVVVQAHRRTITSKFCHVFLERNKIEKEVGGQLTFRLEPGEDGDTRVDLCTLTFDKRGLVSMGAYPSTDFSVDEKPPHVGYANKLVVDTLLHKLQERLTVIAV